MFTYVVSRGGGGVTISACVKQWVLGCWAVGAAISDVVWQRGTDAWRSWTGWSIQ